MVILDTGVIIDHLRQRAAGDTLLLRAARRLAKEELALSVLSVQELYAGKSTLDRTKETLLLATIAPLHILPYGYATARLAGKIARDVSRLVAFADAGIAATALEHQAELLTLNPKDFRGIPGLRFYEVPR